MKDAIGGIFNIQLIILFLVVISGYLAFSVNYTKAFRMKNKIITTIEQYEGYDIGAGQQANVNAAVKDYAKQIGYTSPGTIKTPDGWTGCITDIGFCYSRVNVTDPSSTAKHRVYYKVKTFIHIDVPIINKIMPNIQAFQISGETKIFYTS